MSAAYVLLEAGRITSFLEEQAALILDAFGRPMVSVANNAREVDAEPGTLSIDVTITPPLPPSSGSLEILIDAMKQAGVWSIDTNVIGGLDAANEERDRKRRYSVSLFWIGEWRIAQSITRTRSTRNGFGAVTGTYPSKGWIQVSPSRAR